MPIIQSAPSAGDFFEYVGSVGGPDEELWFQIVLVDVFSDGRGQFIGIVKDTAAEAVLGEVTEEALHHIQPGTAGRREVNVKSAMAGKPSLHLRVVFVRRIVVYDQVEFLPPWCGLIDHPQEPEPLLMPVPVVAHAGH